MRMNYSLKGVPNKGRNAVRGLSSSSQRKEDAYGGFYNMPVAGLTEEQQEVRRHSGVSSDHGQTTNTRDVLSVCIVISTALLLAPCLLVSAVC